MKESHDAGVKALAWSKRQHGILFTGGGANDCKLKAWNTQEKKLLYERNTGSQICSIVTGSKTNDVFTCHGYPDNLVNVWRAKGLKRVSKLKHHEERVLSLALSPDGESMISASAD